MDLQADIFDTPLVLDGRMVDLIKAEATRTVEAWLREEGFTGLDSHGHQWQDGHQVKRTDQQQDSGHQARGQQQQAQQRAQGKARMAAAVKQLQASPKGRRVLARAQKVARQIKDAISSAVKKLLSGLDESSKGGISLIAGGLKDASPKAIVAGIGHIVSSIFECVHQEVYENALSQHFMPGAALAGKAASSAAAHGQAALAWAMGQLAGRTRESVEVWVIEELTDADVALLRQLAQIAAKVLQRQGIKADPKQLAPRILAGLQQSASA